MPTDDANPLNTLRFERIVLTGFMGSGKTTVGRLLATRMGWRFADLDAVIEERTGLSVPRIFEAWGEEAFRLAEAGVLAELLGEPSVVIALGGGAPTIAANRQLLSAAERTAVVHLHAPFAVLYDRCATQSKDPEATARPLLGERPIAQGRYLQRLPLYSAIAHFTVNVSSVAPQAAADLILELLLSAADSPA